MNSQLLRKRIGRIALIAISFFLMGIGNYTQYVAGQAIQFSPSIGNFLFWIGLVILAIPFTLSETKIAELEEDVRLIKEKLGIPSKKPSHVP